MDFDDTPEEASFRAEVRKWLDQNAPWEFRELLQNSVVGHTSLGDVDVLQAARAWQQKKFDAGWACLHWPTMYGGRDASPIQRAIWHQEEGVFSVLSNLFIVGHGMCGPTLMALAGKQQRRRYLPPIASGEEVWCQLFSEPAAGSDLAGIRTRASQVGNDWIVNGQKIWTSGANYSDFGILLARTDPSVPKHRGLTMFFLNMKSAGIEVRPIRQANDRFGFNEVFLTDVCIPDSQRLGDIGNGWDGALTMLMNERYSIGSEIPIGASALAAFYARPARDGTQMINCRSVRSKLATWLARENGLKYTGLRAITALSKGEQPGPENSIGKLVAASTIQEIATHVLELQGLTGVVSDSTIAAAGGRYQEMLLRSPAIRIEGGTDEILKNVIAERVLGLPADIRVDKDIPFNKISTGRA